MISGNSAGLFLIAHAQNRSPGRWPKQFWKSAAKCSVAAKVAARNTDSGPAKFSRASSGDIHVEKIAQTEALDAAMPFNATKPAEHGFANAIAPKAGVAIEPESRLPAASTQFEENSNDKTGTIAAEGVNATIYPQRETDSPRV